MNDDFEMNHERAGSGMSRRVFLRAALASGATILTGRAATVLGAVSKKTTAAGENSTFNIGGDLPVNSRLHRPVTIQLSVSVAIYWSIDLDSVRCVSRERAFGVGHQIVQMR